MSDLIISAAPPQAKIKLGIAQFTIISDQNLMEGPQPNVQAMMQFLVVSHHMLKSLIIELVSRGMLEFIDDSKTSDDSSSGSALDDIDPTKV